MVADELIETEEYRTEDALDMRGLLRSEGSLNAGEAVCACV